MKKMRILAMLIPLVAGNAFAEEYAATVMKRYPQIKDTHFEYGTLMIGVIDIKKGMSPKALAETICLEAPKDGKIERVRVMDAVAAMSGKWRELALQACPKGPPAVIERF